MVVQAGLGFDVDTSTTEAVEVAIEVLADIVKVKASLVVHCLGSSVS
jgi:hypothetical protein